MPPAPNPDFDTSIMADHFDLSPSNTEKPSIYRVTITGGPCAGKTTALAEVSERLRSRGFDVYVVPEAATLLFSGGASFVNATEHQIFEFQAALLRTQMGLENAFIKIAEASKRPSFVLCDRGTCDGRAYMSESLWKRMLKENNWEMVQLRDARYDLVVHLVTAADGAAEFYTLENNKTRTETPEEACEVDRKLQDAWVGHPHLRIVDNKTGFREKINRVDARISELAGIHLSKRIVRKFLLDSSSTDSTEAVIDAMPAAENFAVEQTFLKRLKENNVQESIRRRGKDGVFTYVHKIRRNDRETKRQISSREYRSLLPHCDPSRGTVRIRRQCFLYNGNYFVLDCVDNIEPPARLLRCHCDEEESDMLEIPKWVTVKQEVTGDKDWSMHALSQRVTVHSPPSEDIAAVAGSNAKSL